MDEELSAELLERVGRDQRRAALGLEPEAENRARLLAAEGMAGEHQDDEPTAGG